MWESDHKEGWALKNWCLWTVVLKKTLVSPLDYKEIKPVNPEGNQPWIFIGRIDAEAEDPILWPPDAKNWLTGKDPGAGKDWRQEEKEATEDKIVGWYHWLNGYEFEQTQGDGEGQGSLACCSPRGHEASDTIERLNNNNKYTFMGFPNASAQSRTRLKWLSNASAVKNLPAMQETREMQVWSLGREFPWGRKWQLTPIFLCENPHGQRSQRNTKSQTHRANTCT